MRIETIRALPGPNIYVARPVLRTRIELEGLTEKESRDIPGFVERLLARLPSLADHHCAKGQPGGFVERLHGGTYFGHIVEHVALELTDPVGISVNRGKTVADQPEGWYLVAVTYKSERGMKCLLEIAVELVTAILKDEPYPLEERLEETRQIVARYELGPSTKAIVDAAVRRGIPFSRLNEDSLVRFGNGVHQRYVEATI